MYQEEVKPNPAILKKYILTPTNSSEWLVQLYECPNYRISGFWFRSESKYRVVAVYKPTGRVFAKSDKPAWEYEYEGIRVSE